MDTDASVLAAIDAAFAGIERPAHFTDWQHCCECAEHDALLRSRDRVSLQLEDVNNPGWDPLCFCSAQGLAWYFPALARLALGAGDYACQLLFHLDYAGADNRLLQYCSAEQRAAVAALLQHCILTRAALFEYEADALLAAHTRWSARA